MSPSILILDNLETVFGQDDDDQHQRNPTGKKSYKRTKRTSHVALDRLLSTLLVEIDGVARGGEVMVVATCFSPRLLDRYSTY